MPPEFDQTLLHGRWLHAHEEDEPGRAVFRPASYPLPPARGRTGYDFRADGSVSKIGMGPTDRSTTTEGTWSSDAQGQITIRLPGEPEQRVDVLELGSDRMVLKA
jgi:hypothetical protein